MWGGSKNTLSNWSQGKKGGVHASKRMVYKVLKEKEGGFDILSSRENGLGRKERFGICHKCRKTA